MKLSAIISSALAVCLWACAKTPAAPIQPGEIWPDTDGNHINAHGGGVMAYDGKYYWYGEHKSDSTSSALVGVMCYSSPDLSTWTCHGPALEVVDSVGHDIERGCILERPKVVYNEATGKFVMWFHLELKDQGYRAARAGVAVADRPEGPFTYIGSGRVNPGIYPVDMTPEEIADAQSLSTADYAEWWTPEWRDAIRRGLFLQRDLEGGQMSRDMTVYVDADGRAYHIFSSEDNLTLQIAELDSTYTRHTGRYVRMAPGDQNEAPAIFRRGDTYWMITSGCTGWEPNEARMYSAPSVLGPWTRHANPCEGPNAELTFGGQSTYVITLPGEDNYIFMADIWRPQHPSDARYIWLPIDFAADGTPRLVWRDSWTPGQPDAES